MITENLSTEPKIRLLDGSELICHPLSKPMSEVDNTMQLDTSGTYLTIGCKSTRKHVQETDAEQKAQEEKQLFIENAFFLLRNYKRILNDSRMFLCPIQIRNGLAYTGTSGFHCPTLGVYIEWWLNCATSYLMDRQGNKWLVFYIAGSPLSGANRCGLVDEHGNTKSEQILPFCKLWHPFIDINRRYDYAKNKYEAYSLRQVLDILRSEPAGDYNAVEVIFLRNENNKLRASVESFKKQNESLTSRLHRVLLSSKHNELKRFLHEYNELKEETDNQVSEIQNERIRLRKLLRNNEISNVEYQHHWSPLRQAKEKAIYKLEDFVCASLHSLFPNDMITLDEILDFVNDNNMK